LTVASRPAVVGLSVPNTQTHIPVAVTVTVPLAFRTTEPVVRGDAVGLAALAMAALALKHVTSVAATTARARASHARRRARELPMGSCARRHRRWPPRSFICTPDVTIRAFPVQVIVTIDDGPGLFPGEFPAGAGPPGAGVRRALSRCRRLLPLTVNPGFAAVAKTTEEP
jgi:hypothetical protein